MDVKTYRARRCRKPCSWCATTSGPTPPCCTRGRCAAGSGSDLLGVRQIEVTASATVNVPSRFATSTGARRPTQRPASSVAGAAIAGGRREATGTAHSAGSRTGLSREVPRRLEVPARRSAVDGRGPVPARKASVASQELPESLFHLFTDLIDAEVSEELARELIERLRQGAARGDLDDRVLLKARIGPADRRGDPRDGPAARHARATPAGGAGRPHRASARPRPSPSWPPTSICGNAAASG